MKTNHYEDILDEEMIVLVANGNENISDYLRKLSQAEQRLRILSILDKDRGLFFDIKRLMEGDYIPKRDHIQNVLTMMRQYVQVSETEKKKFGEVMTPIWLVEEMLDKLPIDVWSNPDLKWLDPANGIGVFPSVIVTRLMVGLSEAIPDDEARYRHIVENMLHVCELQKKNMFLFMTTFDPKDEYLLNIFNGSFLSKEFDDHCKNVWRVEKFDIVVGNPPYQNMSKNDHKGAGNTLWDLFVNKSIDYLKDEMFLCFVHPASWRGLGKKKKIGQIIRSKQIDYLEIHDLKDGIKTFGAATRYDWYILRNMPYSAPTIIKDQDGIVYNSIDLRGFYVIPNGKFDIDFSKVFAEKESDRIEILYNCKYHSHSGPVKKEKSDEYMFPCVQYVSSITNKPSCIWWSNTKDLGHFGIPKLITGRMKCGVMEDYTGDFGCSEDCYMILGDVEYLGKVKIALLSSSFADLSVYFDVGGVGDRYPRRIISLLRKDFWMEFV